MHFPLKLETSKLQVVHQEANFHIPCLALILIFLSIHLIGICLLHGVGNR
jgi:hypothetical protein